MSESSPEPKRQFVIRLGELRKPLDVGTNYTIGKESNCDLRLGHGTVSPIHCRLQVIESEVIVEGVVRTSGELTDVCVLWSEPAYMGFEEAARRAVVKWRFEPAHFQGNPIDVKFTISISFRFE